MFLENAKFRYNKLEKASLLVRAPCVMTDPSGAYDDVENIGEWNVEV